MFVSGAACLKENTVLAFFAGQLAEREAAQVEAHVDSCPSCRRLFAGGGPGPGSPLATLRFGTTEAVLASLRSVPDDEYVVGRELARGGMGRILEAVDRHGRRVAIKVLLRATEAATLRFVREMQITARLQHPSTVTLYEAGRSGSGEPFFSMKLVEGRSLLEALAAAGRLEDRLALLPRVLAMTDAIAHAHDRGIIHRDLKPANVLLGDFGETVVIDWGLAKLVDAPDERTYNLDPLGGAGDLGPLTVHGAVMGTPAYMPPEQARGQSLDARADVYSLGAVLYHLLSGAPPHHGSSGPELLARVANDRPRPLEQTARGVPADLAAIVGKSMAREAADRYPTAAQMADDLRRFTTGRLVSAHVYSFSALVKRWLQRNRAAVAVAAAFLALLTGTGAASVVRIVRERDRAERLQVEATTQRNAAEKLVDFLMDSFLSRVQKADRLDLLEGVGEEVARYYRQVDPAGSAPPEVLGRRSLALQTLGLVEQEKHNIARALPLYRDAIELRRRSLTGTGTSAQLVQLSILWHNVGMVEAGRDTDAALRSFARSLEAAEEAVKADPKSMAAHLRVARALQRTSEAFLFRKGDPQTALDRALQARARLASAADALPASAAAMSRLGSIDGRISMMQLQLGQPEEAWQSARRGLDLYARAMQIDPKDAILVRESTRLHSPLADAQLTRGYIDEARAAARTQVQRYQQVLSNDPQNRASERDLGMSHTDACEVEVSAARLSEALSHCRLAVRIFEGQMAQNDTIDARDELARALLRLGRAQEAQGAWPAARQTTTRALEIAGRNAAGDAPADSAQVRLAAASAQLAALEGKMGLTEDASEHARQGLDALERVAGKVRPHARLDRDLHRLRAVMADSELALGRRASALALYERARSGLAGLAAAAPGMTALAVDRAEVDLKLAGALAGDPAARTRARELRAQARTTLDQLQASGRLLPADRGLVTRGWR